MQLTIHRGTKEVGGTCIEVSAGNTRIVLDIGMPLFDVDRKVLNTWKLYTKSTEELAAEGILPNVSGLFTDGPSPDAILLSHAHLDHSGLLDRSAEDIPIYATTGTSKMLLAGSVFAQQPSIPRDRHRVLSPEIPVQIESVATLLGIGSDMLSIFPYFPCPIFIKEDEYVWTRRIRCRSDRGDHAC